MLMIYTYTLVNSVQYVSYDVEGGNISGSLEEKR